VVVGGGTSADGDEAFRWEGGVMTGLGSLDPLIPYSFGSGVSGNGEVVVGGGASSLGFEAFRWQNGAMSGLGEYSYSALGASWDGSVIVGFELTDLGEERAFVWTEAEGARDLKLWLEELELELPGWTLIAALDVSLDGTRIVGNGLNPDGNYEGWLVVIPEPSAASLGGVGVLGAVLARSLLRKRASA
jgi:probable HAF family extracellular repeat protein